VRRLRGEGWGGGAASVAPPFFGGVVGERKKVEDWQSYRVAQWKGAVNRLALFAGLICAGRLRLFCSWGVPCGFGVLVYAELPGGMESAGEDVFAGSGEPNVGHAYATPTAGNGEEDFGEFSDEGLLLLESEHEIAVALLGGSEGGEDAAADAEVGLAPMGGLFGSGKAEGDTAEIANIHGEYGNAGVGIWGKGMERAEFREGRSFRV